MRDVDLWLAPDGRRKVIHPDRPLPGPGRRYRVSQARSRAEAERLLSLHLQAKAKSPEELRALARPDPGHHGQLVAALEDVALVEEIEAETEEEARARANAAAQAEVDRRRAALAAAEERLAALGRE